MLGFFLQYSSEMLRSVNRNELFGIKLYTVDVNEGTSVSLRLEHISHEGSLSTPIWTMHKNVGFRFDEGQKHLHVIESELPLFIFEVVAVVSLLVNLSLNDLIVNLLLFL